MIYWCSGQLDDILLFRTVGWYIVVQDSWMIYSCSGQLDDIFMFRTVGWYIVVQDSWMSSEMKPVARSLRSLTIQNAPLRLGFFYVFWMSGLLIRKYILTRGRRPLICQAFSPAKIIWKIKGSQNQKVRKLVLGLQSFPGIL